MLLGSRQRTAGGPLPSVACERHTPTRRDTLSSAFSHSLSGCFTSVVVRTAKFRHRTGPTGQRMDARFD